MGVTRHPLCTTLATRHLQGIPADEALIRRLERSFEGLGAADSPLAQRFYDRLFARHPELRAMFPVDMAAQQKKLVDSLTAIIDNLRDPLNTQALLEELGRKHVDFGAKPEHYPWVCESLIGALAESSGPNWTGELQAEWTVALELVSAAMLAGARPTACG